ncbi:hypothetical protein P7C70_g5335, partial [Phenoliferia sp. Uapishka_3]
MSPREGANVDDPFYARYENMSSEQAAPRIIPPTPPPDSSGSPDHLKTASSSTGINTGLNSASGRPPRRVQWPAELSTHASHTMGAPTSPQTLEDSGAQDALTRALEEHRRHPDRPLPSRYVGGSAPVSESGSSDGDHEERLAEMRDNMEVFVDEGETDGLPSVGTRGVEAKAAKAAWGLVRGYTSGSRGFMRNRKNGGFKGGQGDNTIITGDEESTTGTTAPLDEDEKANRESGVGGFFKSLIHSDTTSDVPVRPQEGFSGSTNMGSGAGVLSALMALQAAQQNQDPASGGTSAATSPATSRAPSVMTTHDDGDSSDEEAERIKFTEKQRAKRAKKNALHSTSTAVADATKFVAGTATKTARGTAGAVYHLGTGTAGAVYSLGAGTAGAVLGGFGHRRALSSSALSSLGNETPKSPKIAPSPVTVDAESPVIGRHSHSASTSSSRLGKLGSSSTGHLPLDSPKEGIHSPRKKKGVFGETVQHMKRLGETLGLEYETSRTRPEAARSGAGVFGGLILGTSNIAGVASPASTTLAPSASRPGYHLSRYSAPAVPVVKSPGERKSMEFSWSRPSSRPSSRPQSLFGGSEQDHPLSPKSPNGASTATNSAPDSPLISPKAEAPSRGALKPKPAFSLNLKDLAPHTPKFGFHSGKHTPSGENSPRRESYIGEYFTGGHPKETQEEREKREWEKEKRRRKKVIEKRKQEEVFITQHVAAILSRQEFLMKMGRAFMMFGAPSHRLEAQIQATARVLEINCQAIYIPGVLMMSFGDVATHTSDIKFLKQANGLDLGKLLGAYYVYYNVVHDKISVTEASVELDDLMRAPPKYKLWQNVIIGGLASAFIQPSAFYGSFIDCLVSIPLGGLLVLVQVVVSRNDLYSSLFEIVIACVNSFLAAALASTKHFCFAAVASGSVVLILPGYIVLCGSLELANRSIVSGSVRLVYSILYSLFLGFGLAIGSEIYQRITGLDIAGATDFTCSSLRVDAPWYKAVIPQEWYIFTIPMYCLMLGLRNGQPLFRKETVVMLLIGSAGFAANFYGSKAFPDRADISSALGSFAVGFLGNLYGKFTRTSSPFVVMVVGVLIQLPSGLSNGGLLQFASDTSSSSSYSAGFNTAESLVEVAIGLTVGLFVAAAVVNLFFGGGRRRGSNLSSF